MTEINSDRQESALDFTNGNYYQAGINTSNYSYCGFYLDIYGGNIANDDPTNKVVRITPHLANTSDYLAFVLEDRGVANQLEVWTYHQYTDTWAYIETISKTTWYRFGIFINSTMDYSLGFAPSGDILELVGSGTFAGYTQNCIAAPFLEQYINQGYSCAQHGNSGYWKMYLYTTSGSSYYWDSSVSTSDYVVTIPSGLTNPLQKNYSYVNPSYFLYTWSP